MLCVQQSSPEQVTVMENKSWDESQLRKYNLVLDQIPRLNHDDPKVDELMSQNVSMKFVF